MKELLKSDSICQSYIQIKKGPVFWLTVYCTPTAFRLAGPKIVCFLTQCAVDFVKCAVDFAGVCYVK